MRKLAWLLIIGGLGCLLYGGWQIGFSQEQQQQALDEAKEVVSGSSHEVQGEEQQPQEKEEHGERNEEQDADPEQTDTDSAELGQDSLSPEEMALQEGDIIGILEIPRLDRELPIIHGTDEDELERGVGHFKGTALPDQQDQILLSGHRDTVFRQMGELEHGDELIVHMSYGTYVYRIYETDIVDADDTTVIRSTAPDEILTLSTCYPFSYVGPAPDRYIIYAEPVA